MSGFSNYHLYGNLLSEAPFYAKFPITCKITNEIALYQKYGGFTKQNSPAQNARRSGEIVCYSCFRSELCNLFHFHYVQFHFRLHNTVHIPGHGLCKLEGSIGTYIFARCAELHIVCAGSGFPP